MKSTVTIHMNQGVISKRHNERDNELCSNEPHIDLDNVHGQSFYEEIHKRDLRQVYLDELNESLGEYNAKQKRADRN